MVSIPKVPKIYYIVHIDNLPSILADSKILCDAEIIKRPISNTAIGITEIKERRLKKNLASYPDLCVGECVPFYFCPRSVMLYIISQRNHPKLIYKGGQENILHLEADLYRTISWANENKRRWVFTLSNAGSSYFEERYKIEKLGDLDWEAIQSRKWNLCKEEKQAEFLLEHDLPFHLVDYIGVYTGDECKRTLEMLNTSRHKPVVEINKDWYY